jgi:hypothetical protein
MIFVLRPESFQDENGFIDGRSFDLDGLEAAFKRGILLDILAILVQRGGADAL